MKRLAPAARSHLWLTARLVLFTLVTAPAVTALVHPWIERWPLLGVVLALLEGGVQAVKPAPATALAPATVRVPAPTSPSDEYLS